jgi:hypothetical protein
MNERDMLLSEAVDCLTAAIEIEDDEQLREARELVLSVVFGYPRRWWQRILRRAA